ncbi:MAG TPA: hypothetical protein VJB82_02065 [Candidatus Peribacterales bacterium]|nr:hypothetical protein [Candidatus Peribacterales bacterium]
MIQTLGDVLLLVTTISVGIVAFLFAVFLYHLIFVVMDLRQVMKRLNDLSEELEELLMKPVEVVSMGFAWIQKLLTDLYFADRPKKEKKAKKHKKKRGG